MRPRTVDVHFDPMCPFAYATSVWLRDVRAQIGIDLNLRFFSLEEINRVQGKKHPWERPWSYGWSLMRVGALLRRRGWVAVFFQQLAHLLDAGEGIVEGNFHVRCAGRRVHAADAGHGAQQLKHAGHVGGIQGGSKLERMMP